MWVMGLLNLFKYAGHIKNKCELTTVFVAVNQPVAAYPKACKGWDFLYILLE